MNDTGWIEENFHGSNGKIDRSFTRKAGGLVARIISYNGGNWHWSVTQGDYLSESWCKRRERAIAM